MLIHGAPTDDIAFSLGRGVGLSRDHALVHVRASRQHGPVRWKLGVSKTKMGEMGSGIYGACGGGGGVCGYVVHLSIRIGVKKKGCLVKKIKS